MNREDIRPFFLDSTAGRIFLILRQPHGASDCVLLVPPFGEEMNKCRRQLAETTEGLVGAGYAVVLPDLYGTGDSEGEFVEARWDVWQADIVSTIEWIRRSGLSLYAMIAIRLGCALGASALAMAGAGVRRSVFWQPVESGRQFMTQFLRLRVASSMMEGNSRETVEGLKQKLITAESLEVAGYKLSRALFEEVDALKLTALLGPRLGELIILEVGSSGDGGLSAVGKGIATGAEASGVQVTGARLPGEPYWAATEIVVNSGLAARSVQFLTEQRTS